MDTNIEQWAKKLGFHGANEKSFRESWMKLVPPSMRSVWRHIISHVLPVKDANYIRKLCLLYKLESEESVNESIKLQANIKSLKEYEKYTKINNMKVNLAYINGQIENLSKEIKELQSKLESEYIKHKHFKENEEEKLIKCRLIELKIKSTNDEIDNLKELQNLVDHYVKVNSAMKQIEDPGKWEQEVIDHCKNLPENHEIDTLCEQLDSLVLSEIDLKHKTDNITDREKKNGILQEMQTMHITKFLERERYRDNWRTLEQKIITLKTEIINKFEMQEGNRDQVDRLNFIINSYIQSIRENNEGAVLKDILNSWTVNKNRSSTDEYVALQNEIAQIDCQIENKAKSIMTSLEVQEKLIKFCEKAQKKMLMEPADSISDLKSRHKHLVHEIKEGNFLPKEIELFLKTNTRRKNGLDNSLNSNPDVFDCMRKLKKYNEVLAELKLDPPQIDKKAEEDIIKIKNNEIDAEKHLGNTFGKVKDIVNEIKQLKYSSSSYLEFWKAQPLVEGYPSCSQDYIAWRERYKKAMKTLRVCKSEFEENMDDTLASSTLQLACTAEVQERSKKEDQN